MDKANKRHNSRDCFFVAYQCSLYKELKPLPKSNVHEDQLFNLYLTDSHLMTISNLMKENGQLLSTNISIFFQVQ